MQVASSVSWKDLAQGDIDIAVGEIPATEHDHAIIRTSSKPSKDLSEVKEEKDWSPPSSLWSACSHGLTKEVIQLLQERPDIEKTGGWRESTPLDEAVCGGYCDIVAMLLEKGADVSAQTTHGGTPLHHAASAGKEEIVALLLAHKAGVSDKNQFGVTPLHQAALQGHSKVARLLLDNGADVSAKTPGGETAEDIATAGFYLHLATMLKAAAANNKEEE